jgi:hypothetical protein
MPAPARKRASASVSTRILLAQYVLQHRCGRVQAEFTSTHTTLGSRPAPGTPSAKRSVGHVEQPACRTRCPKEPHAQRSWHLQRSPPAQSEDPPPEVWLPTLSDDERLARGARTHARAIARRRGCFLGCVSCKFSHFKFGQQSSLFQDISGFLKNERKREKRRW